MSNLATKLELVEAERDAARLYSQGFARRIRELTAEVTRLSEANDRAATIVMVELDHCHPADLFNETCIKCSILAVLNEELGR